MDQIFNSEEVRNIILNAHKIKKFNKCGRCCGTGWENWNSETGDDLSPGKIINYDGIRDDGKCEKCYGVGYTDLLMYDAE